MSSRELNLFLNAVSTFRNNEAFQTWCQQQASLRGDEVLPINTRHPEALREFPTLQPALSVLNDLFYEVLVISKPETDEDGEPTEEELLHEGDLMFNPDIRAPLLKQGCETFERDGLFYLIVGNAVF